MYGNMSKLKDIVLSEASRSENANGLSFPSVKCANCYISFKLGLRTVSSFEQGLEATRVDFQQLQCRGQYVKQVCLASGAAQRTL